MLKSRSSLHPRPSSQPSRRSGFTLIEILVAIGIMSLLFAVILVPLRLGFDSFHIGKARAEVQQQSQQTLQQISNDLHRAKFVFPNTRVVGVSDVSNPSSPCPVPTYDSAKGFQPYIRSKEKAISGDGRKDPAANSYVMAYGVCSVTGTTGSANEVEAWSNPARIDMLQLRDDTANGLSSNVGADYIVSYYTRRLNINLPYDIVDNPVVLYRAQMPYRYYNPTTTKFDDFPAPTPAPSGSVPVGALNVLTQWTQMPAFGSCASSDAPKLNRDFLWLTHDLYGEANLEPLTRDVGPVAGSHTLATPRSMGLVTPHAGLTADTIDSNDDAALVPELSFVESATGGNQIDRVTINMTLAQYDQAGAGTVNGQAAAQRVRVSQTVDLPNVGCAP